MMQVCGTLFSLLAAMCMILRRFADRLNPCLMGSMESLLMAAASYCLGSNAAAIAWVASSFSYLLLVFDRFSPLLMLGTNILFSILAIIFNNNGWLAILPIIAMQWMLQRRCFISYWEYQDCDWSSLSKRKKNTAQLASIQLILAIWIAFSLIIGDWPSTISRIILFCFNFYLFFKLDVFSQESKDRRAYVRYHRNYKRHLL